MPGEHQCGSPDIINCLLNQLAKVGGEQSAPTVCAICKKSERDLNRELRLAGQLFKTSAEKLPAADIRSIEAVEQRTIEATAESVGPPTDPSHRTCDKSASDSHEPGGRFTVLRDLAENGLAKISIAKDREVPRYVSFKTLLTEHADSAKSRVRFLREAKITGRLEHPGVPPVYSLGRLADGRPYYVTRLVEGESLGEAIVRLHQRGNRQREWMMQDLFRRFLFVCDAVSYAHVQGIVHCGIKPDSILLGDHGETMIVDWGSATFLDPDEPESSPPSPSPLPSDGSVRASDAPPGDRRGVSDSSFDELAFMSPEFAGGDRGQRSHHCDIFALGATLHAIATGKPPYDDHAPKLAQRVKRGEIEIAASMPPPLKAICRRAMEPVAPDRYGSAAELADDLGRWMADLPVSVYQETAIDRAKRWLRKLTKPS